MAQLQSISTEKENESVKLNTASEVNNDSLSYNLDNMASTIMIYPNPITDEINLKLNNFEGNYLNVQIYDLNGRSIYQEKLNCDISKTSYRLNLVNKLPSGLYLIKVFGDKMLFSKQIIIL